LPEQAALFVFWKIAALRLGQKAFEGQLERLFAQNFGFERAADQRRASSQDRDFDTFQIRIGKQALFGRRALAAQAAALPDGELSAEFGLDQPGQRQIEVIAAEEQMLSHRRAREIDAIALARHANEAEIAGAAAHVTDEYDLAVEQQLSRAREIVGDP